MIDKTKKILEQYGLSPKKYLGQNFLINPEIVKKIVSAGNVGKKDTVLEVGGGLGVLTEKLAEKAGQVIVVEKDPSLVKVLADIFKNKKNVKIIHQDALNFEMKQGAYKIVANLPYQISSNFIRRFLEHENKPQLMVLMLQKEVVERILAKPGQMNLLALSVQYFSEPKKVMSVSKNNFYPVPKVDSAVIKIDKIKNIESRNLFKIAKAGFSQKRKQLKNNLKSIGITEKKTVLALKKINLNEKIRAQELSVEDWERLTLELT